MGSESKLLRFGPEGRLAALNLNWTVTRNYQVARTESAKGAQRKALGAPSACSAVTFVPSSVLLVAVPVSVPVSVSVSVSVSTAVPIVVTLPTIIPVPIPVPAVVMIKFAAVSFPVTLEEHAVVITRRVPAGAAIGCPGPVTLMPFPAPSFRIPVSIDPHEIGSWPGRNHANNPWRRRRSDSDSERKLRTENRSSGEKCRGEHYCHDQAFHD